MAKSRLHGLSELGQSVWIDSLSRGWLKSGDLARWMEEDALTGVTSNPTIFQKAMSEGDWYDDQLREVLAEETDLKEIFLRLAITDIEEACDLFRSVWDEGEGKDGYVSMEVDPNFAYDTSATIEEAARFHDWVERPNLYVKIPATAPGLPAIEEMIARGRNINVTLIFSLERHTEVAEAYIRGLERLAEVGRVDLQGKLAVANAKLAYQNYKEIFSGDRWDALVEKGATPQWCLWASTSTKNPEYRDVLYVEDLIGAGTVNTMPRETIEAFQDHGEVALTVEDGIDEAKQVFEQVAEAGVDYDDVTDTLEREGVQKFIDSLAELLDGIAAKRGQLAAA